MSSGHVCVVVRCEDLQQRVFFYRMLCEKGVHPRSINIKHAPPGHGDARRWVCDQHAVEVPEMRRKRHLATGVIAALDADTNSVAERKAELDAALFRSGAARRAGGEPIATLVPRRNIETWIHHLLGTPVDELTRYPKLRGRESDCAPAVAAFVRRCPSGMDDNDPPSLRDCCDELTAFLAHFR